MVTEYKVDIDFNLSSTEWHKNKINMGGGNYNYKCMSKTLKGLDCKNKPIIHTNLCYIHTNMNN